MKLHSDLISPATAVPPQDLNSIPQGLALPGIPLQRAVILDLHLTRLDPVGKTVT